MSGDIFLAEMVKIVETTDYRPDITLQVGGLVLSGSIVPATEMQKQVDQLASNAVGNTYRAISEPDKVKEDNEGLPVYIHLKNVKFILPAHGDMSSSNFPYWRYLIANVSGWTFGNIEVGRLTK